VTAATNVTGAIPRLFIDRVIQNDFATYAQLHDETDAFRCVTIELPWRDDAENISCIPAGTYMAERYFSPKHGYPVFRLIGVPNREYVEVHIANLPEDLLGCIGVGLTFAHVKKANGHEGPGILGSSTAFHMLMMNYPQQRVLFTVRDVSQAAQGAVECSANR
jgi:hypothetical protein